MNQYSYKIPRYINKPLTYLGLELIDIVAIYVGLFYCYIAESFVHTVLTIIAVIWFLYKKKNSPQGYFKHLLYCASLLKPDMYPDFSEQEFLE
jgi:hypothetical protein